MMKYRIFLALVLACSFFATAQNKYEREYRIKKSQFPKNALGYIQEKLEGTKRMRFYKEIDSMATTYEAKFKKDRLWYGIEFTADGELEDIEILITSVDIPDESYEKMTRYLKQNFTKYSIRKIRQQYPITPTEKVETTVKNAFQNLMLPSINYKLIIMGKKDKNCIQYEVLFDNEGDFKTLRKALPPNYDRVLY